MSFVLNRSRNLLFIDCFTIVAARPGPSGRKCLFGIFISRRENLIVGLNPLCSVKLSVSYYTIVPPNLDLFY